MIEVKFIHVLEGADSQVELVPVRGGEFEVRVPPGGGFRPGHAEGAEEPERVRQEEGPVMMKVVIPPVGDGRLGGNRFQSRVGVDHAGGGVKPRVGDPPGSHPPVVVGHIG